MELRQIVTDVGKTVDQTKAKVLVNPHYRGLLQRAGLTRVEDFLALPGVIICGHRHRHVARLTIGEGSFSIGAFLKRELRVPWKVYLSSAWDGFGWVSRSYREALMLRELQACGVPCPEWIAAGEDGNGQAFLLVRELPASREMREFLRDRTTSRSLRLRLIRRLGEDLAKLHDAGFHHADLHSKHVLVGSDAETVYFLDWQRARRCRSLSWRRRLRDLAALDATLDDTLASPRERLRCLRGYLRASARLQPNPRGSPRPSFTGVVTSVCRQALGLLRKRYIREVRQAFLPIGQQNLVWLDGEALCVTREFQAAVAGRIPGWLAQAADTEGPNGVRHERRQVPGIRPALLIRRWVRRPLHWLRHRLLGRSFISPEFEQAAVLFRLQRYGITTPRLLAVGQRYRRPWELESFLLTEPVLCHDSLPHWLSQESARAEPRRRYRHMLRESGSVLRRLHEAGCYLNESTALAVRDGVGEDPAVVVSNLEGIRARRRRQSAPAMRDLRQWRRTLAQCAGSRTDALRFCLGYLGQDHLTPAAKRLFRCLLGQRCHR